MNRLVQQACVILGFAMGFAQGCCAVETGWPVKPTDSDHPLGATLGEFQDTEASVPVAYQHTGVDILTTPWDEAADDNIAPWVTVTTGGTVAWLENSAGTLWNHADIETPDGRRYRYVHLAYQSYDNDFLLAERNQTEVASGAFIARVTSWVTSSCANEYNHLHYDIRKGTDYLNPLSDIGVEVNPDQLAPEILEVGLAKERGRNGQWSPFDTITQMCTKVKGKVDIVAQVRDRDNAGLNLPGTSNVGVYRLRWRVCPKTSPDCNEWDVPHVFESMPTNLGNQTGNTSTNMQFSTLDPWKSDFDECSATVNQTFMVVTSSPSKSWDTTSGEYPNGSYIVSVEARDIAGNVDVHDIPACVEN